MSSLRIVTPDPEGMVGVNRHAKEICELDPDWKRLFLSEHDPSDINGHNVLFCLMHQEYLDWINQASPLKIAFSWTSPPLQSELAQEPTVNEENNLLKLRSIELDLLSVIFDLVDQIEGARLFTADREFAECFPETPSVQYLPLPMSNPVDSTESDPPDDDSLRIGLFGISEPRKNYLTQILAARKLHKDGMSVEVHTNAFNDSLKKLANQWDVPIKHHGWMTKENYLSTIQQMQLGAQCFVSESHSYVTADFLTLGVPTIVSPTIASNFQFDRFDFEDFVVDTIDDPIEIAQTIKRVKDRYDLAGGKIRSRSKQLVRELSKDYNTMTRETIQSWCQ